MSYRLDFPTEHRIVYEVLDNAVVVHSAKGHYE